MGATDTSGRPASAESARWPGREVRENRGANPHGVRLGWRRAGRTRGPAAAALAGLGLAGCVFTPPPPLPEELADQRSLGGDTRLTSFDAKGTAVRTPDGRGPDGPPAGDDEAVAAGDEAAAGGSPNAPETSGAGAASQVYEFERGQTAPAGMESAQRLAYNAAQGDPVAMAVRDGSREPWSLNDGLEGMGGEGELWVVFHTARGDMECELFEDRVPDTVGNFIGLARGLRPALDRESGQWVKRRYYDGVEFHRVIPGFMVQSGDPSGSGFGNPGYVIADEIRPDLVHDRAGLLSMANRGPGTGSAQFFITLGPTPHLDGLHTIFGECTEASMAIADDISLVPRNENDKPLEPEVIDKVTVERR